MAYLLRQDVAAACFNAGGAVELRPRSTLVSAECYPPSHIVARVIHVALFVDR